MRAILLAWLPLALSAAAAPGATLSSAHFRIVGASTSGGGMLGPRAAGSAGQSEALGFSGSSATLRTLIPGFWGLLGGFPTLDVDADLIPAYRDVCPFAHDPGQADSGGVLSGSPDGIGDACQCGDVNDDGVVDDFDVDTYRGALAQILFLTPAGLSKCGVIAGPPQCTVRDVAVIARDFAPVPLAPGIQQSCGAASAP